MHSYTYFVGKQGNELHPAHVEVYRGPDFGEAMREYSLALEAGDEYAVLEALLDKEN